jgi:tryptophan-rich sensory protein
MNDTVVGRSLAGARLPGHWKRRLGDLALIVSPLIVGGISGLITNGQIATWYRTLERPDWNPPDQVFGPVWTTLYLLMGVALRTAVRSRSDDRRRALAVGLFALQLALNFGWSWIFFVEHELGLAVIEIVALWLAILATAAAFARIRPVAGALLLPYLAWVTFAAALSAAVWQLND